VAYAGVERADELAGQVTQGHVGSLPRRRCDQPFVVGPEWGPWGAWVDQSQRPQPEHSPAVPVARSGESFPMDAGAGLLLLHDQPRWRRSTLSEWNAPIGAPMAARMVAARISSTTGNEQITRASGASATVVSMRSSTLATSAASRRSCSTR
jgi:hypothetical protein